jgi:hypothetical protein
MTFKVDYRNPLLEIRWIDLPPTGVHYGANLANLTMQTVRNTPFMAAFFRHDQDDSVSYSYQLPHNWVIGSDIKPHMHFVPHGTTGGNVVISGQYTFTSAKNDGLALPENADWTTFKVTKTIETANLFKEHVVSVPVNVPSVSWLGQSSHLHILWKRPGQSDTDDTFTSSNPTGTQQANIQLVSFDAHVQIRTLGTTQEFPTGTYI